MALEMLSQTCPMSPLSAMAEYPTTERPAGSIGHSYVTLEPTSRVKTAMRPCGKDIKEYACPLQSYPSTSTNLRYESGNQGYCSFNRSLSPILQAPTITMHFTQHLALVGLFAATALAAPIEDSCPQKPAKPAPAPTTNACGNDATPYCCNTDVLGFGSCYTYGTSSVCFLLLRIAAGKSTFSTDKHTCGTEFSSQCSQTVICCNAENVSLI